MRSRLLFPFFNGFVGAIFGALIGYYVFHLMGGLLLGALAGIVLGVLVEGLLRGLGEQHWLYKRRVLLTILAEILLAVFVIGPYAYAIVETAPMVKKVITKNAPRNTLASPIAVFASEISSGKASASNRTMKKVPI